MKYLFVILLAACITLGCLSVTNNSARIHVEQTGWGFGRYSTPVIAPIPQIATFVILEPDQLAKQEFKVTCTTSNSAFGHMKMPAPRYAVCIPEVFLGELRGCPKVMHEINEAELKEVKRLEHSDEH